MRTSMSEILDLALTQAIERYMEMESAVVYDAIIDEWPQQTAIILLAFFGRSSRNLCNVIPTFIQIPRELANTMKIMQLDDCHYDDE